MSSIPVPTPPTTTTDKKQAGTHYMVLRALADPSGADRWEGFETVTARSADEAIRLSTTDTPGTYVAIPSRSWRPRRVSVEQVSRVKLEGA